MLVFDRTCYYFVENSQLWELNCQSTYLVLRWRKQFKHYQHEDIICCVKRISG